MIEVYQLNDWLVDNNKSKLKAVSIPAWVIKCREVYTNLNICDKLIATKHGEIGVKLDLIIGSKTLQLKIFNATPYTADEFIEQLLTTKYKNNVHIKEQLDQIIQNALKEGLKIADLERCLNSFTPTKNPETLVTKINDRVEYTIKITKAGKALNIHLFHQTFTKARKINRELIAVLGPTNSGKTYEAFSALTTSKKGIYLAPLRLMALEGYDKLSQCGINCKLLTGEERIGSITATHVSSTVEMFDPTEEYDVAVIDEVQMLGDPDRGWAWTNAILGIKAKKVYLLGAPEYEQALNYCAKLTGETLTIIKKERLCPLIIQTSTETIHNKAATAFIGFSRRAVLSIRRKLGNNCAVIYGSLGPEVRKDQAEKFSKGVYTTLASTDAIGMGLNLPIETIVFTELTKWDGKETRLLTATEVKQIAGRAGRFGQYPTGFVTTTNASDLQYLNTCLHAQQTNGSEILWVVPHLYMLKYLSKILGTKQLYTLLTAFNAIELEGSRFKRCNLEALNLLALRLSPVAKYLPLSTQFALCQTPINITNEEHLRIWNTWQLNVCNELPNSAPVIPPNANLADSEEFVKLASAYKWLHHKLSTLFPEFSNAEINAKKVNDYILQFLANNSK